MIYIREKENLNEMAIMAVSARSDGLPFRITIMSPDYQPPHVHLMDLQTGKKCSYQFLLTKNTPRRFNDIKDYKGTLPDDQKQLICDWANKPSKTMPKFTNWERLISTWLPNEKW